jgi:hypothetical protein
LLLSQSATQFFCPLIAALGLETTASAPRSVVFQGFRAAVHVALVERISRTLQALFRVHLSQDLLNNDGQPYGFWHV